MKAAATKRFVLDASVAVAWCFEDEATKFTESVLDLLSAGAEALVPAIWPVEVANALLIAERRKRILLAQVTALLEWCDARDQEIGDFIFTLARTGARPGEARALRWSRTPRAANSMRPAFASFATARAAAAGCWRDEGSSLEIECC